MLKINHAHLIMKYEMNALRIRSVNCIDTVDKHLIELFYCIFGVLVYVNKFCGHVI